MPVEQMRGLFRHVDLDAATGKVNRDQCGTVGYAERIVGNIVLGGQTGIRVVQKSAEALATAFGQSATLQSAHGITQCLHHGQQSMHFSPEIAVGNGSTIGWVAAQQGKLRLGFF